MDELFNYDTINIICDDFNTIHRNIPFYYSSLIFKHAFTQLGFKSNIILSSSTEIAKLCENTIVLIYPHLFNLLKNIQCKIILYNSECLIVDVNKNIPILSNDVRVKMVWDYTYKNIKHNLIKHTFVPPVYAPIKLYTLPSNNKDIDILFYGASSSSRHFRRYNILQKFKNYKNLNKNIHWVETFNNLNDKINCISRAKIVLIIHTYEPDLPIDYFRMNELILQKQFFIAETPQIEDIELYNRYKEHIIFTEYNNIIETCLNYLEKTQADRDYIANNIYNFFKQEEQIEKYITKELINELK
jgi:hypothetical protein